MATGDRSMTNEVLPSRLRLPHWSKDVLEVVAFFAYDTAEAQRDATATIKATFGYEAAEWAKQEFVKLAAKSATEPSPAWMARLEPFESWNESLLAAVAIAVEGEAQAEEIA